MGENTRIEWADHTFNPWIGCTKVSPACDHCYAETLATARLGVAWGSHAERRRTAPSTWRQPLAWNRRAEREGRRFRVFCASLADVFDNQASEDWRVELWRLIRATPHLDWLLLTKRPQNIAKMLPSDLDHGRGNGWQNGPWPNVWLGTTVENQAEAYRRIPHLLAVPATIRFLSCEPLLEAIDLSSIQARSEDGCLFGGSRIDWVIAGGESGPKARPSHPDWFRSLRDQCQGAGVPFFFKQWGEWAPGENPDRAQTRTEIAAWWQENEWDIEPITPKVGQEMHIDDSPDVWRLGKKAAGALLDGREWREAPA